MAAAMGAAVPRRSVVLRIPGVQRGLLPVRWENPFTFVHGSSCL